VQQRHGNESDDSLKGDCIGAAGRRYCLDAIGVLAQ
jgi:hypothetical protein